ncbi:MAG: dihydrodipicolinate synthase family protein [Evtepia sp.]
MYRSYYPFQSTGAIDYTAFAKQIDRQLEAGIDALCVCGTTGESAALSAEEHVKLVDYCVDYVAGRCKVLAGSGSNDTVASLYLCQHAERVRSRCAAAGDTILQ